MEKEGWWGRRRRRRTKEIQKKKTKKRAVGSFGKGGGAFLDFFLDFFSHFFQKKRRENDLSISLKEAKEERDLFSGLIPNKKKKKKKRVCPRRPPPPRMSRSVAFLGFSTSSKSGQQHQHNTNSRRRRALFSFFKKSGNGDDEKNAPTDCVKVEEDANDASSLRRAISLSQSFCAIASTTGGFNNFELVPPTSFDDDDDDVVFFPPRGATFKEERRLMRLNQRPLWTEEDGYEREMRLATASFLAATTLAVGQPAVALDFVVVDPAGTQTCIVIRRRRSFLLARASSNATRTEIGTGLKISALSDIFSVL